SGRRRDCSLSRARPGAGAASQDRWLEQLAAAPDEMTACASAGMAGVRRTASLPLACVPPAGPKPLRRGEGLAIRVFFGRAIRSGDNAFRWQCGLFGLRLD